MNIFNRELKQQLKEARQDASDWQVAYKETKEVADKAIANTTTALGCMRSQLLTIQQLQDQISNQRVMIEQLQARIPNTENP